MMPDSEPLTDDWLYPEDACVPLDQLWSTVEAIGPDGSSEWWLLRRGAPVVWERGPVPDHEQEGRLPREVRHRLGLQCSAVTKTTGKRCTRDAPLGGYCIQHRQGREPIEERS